MDYENRLRLRNLGWAGLVLSLSVLAAPAASAEVKMGFVNVAKVLELAPQAEAARNRIERECAPKDRELLRQQKDVRSLEDRLVKNKAVLADVERGRSENEIRAAKRELRRAQDEFREDLNHLWCGNPLTSICGICKKSAKGLEIAIEIGGEAP